MLFFACECLNCYARYFHMDFLIDYNTLFIYYLTINTYSWFTKVSKPSILLFLASSFSLKSSTAVFASLFSNCNSVLNREPWNNTLFNCCVSARTSCVDNISDNLDAVDVRFSTFSKSVESNVSTVVKI